MLKSKTASAPHRTTLFARTLQYAGLLYNLVFTRLRSTASILPHHSYLFLELRHTLYFADLDTDPGFISYDNRCAPMIRTCEAMHALPWRLLQPLNLGQGVEGCNVYLWCRSSRITTVTACHYLIFYSPTQVTACDRQLLLTLRSVVPARTIPPTLTKP